MLIYRFCLIVFCGLLSACAAAPVQEMSDARQAIEAAISVGAEGSTNAAMREAEQLMVQAQQALEVRRYRAARNLALAAKTNAISARSIVQQEALYPATQRIE